MSLYSKIPVWDPRAKERYARLKSRLDTTNIIKGVKPILSKEEKMHQSKPHNKMDYERQFKKYHDPDFLKKIKGFEGW